MLLTIALIVLVEAQNFLMVGSRGGIGFTATSTDGLVSHMNVWGSPSLIVLF